METFFLLASDTIAEKQLTVEHTQARTVIRKKKRRRVSELSPENRKENEGVRVV